MDGSSTRSDDLSAVEIENHQGVMEREREETANWDEDNDCDHVCSGNCRRVGCNCLCGEWHKQSVHVPRRISIEEIDFGGDIKVKIR